MAEMIVTTPEVKHIVWDYEFMFASGMMLPLTVNPSAGDTIEFNDKYITVNLKEKASLTDPTQTIPAEVITIFVNHLATNHHRIREVTDMTPEQRVEWTKTLKGSIQ